MAKINLNAITGAFNLANINNNFKLIEDALNDKTLYRDNPEGEANQMHNHLDMNNSRIYNLPEPVQDNEPLRKQDGKLIAIELNEDIAEALLAAAQAADNATAAANIATATAGNAVALANVADDKADASLVAAQNASSQAAQASSNASLAMVEAAGAASAAQIALDQANSVLGVALAAQSSADSAAAVANTANTTANTANVTANAASAAVALKAKAGVNTDITQLNAVQAINGGALRGRTNNLLNGAFDVWQRGASFRIAGRLTRTADRWMYDYSNTTGTVDVSRTPVVVDGLAGSAFSPKYACQVNCSVAPTSNTYQELTSQIESVRTLQGRRVTVSFYAFANTTAKPINVRLTQFFGLGGTASVILTSPVITVQVGAWQRYSATFDLPAITGKTIGATGNDSLNVSFMLPINQTFNLYFTGVQIEEGGVMSAYEERPYCETYMDCLRYLQTSYDDGVAPGTVVTPGSVGANRFTVAAVSSIQFKATMRVIPTVSYYNPITGAAGSWYAPGTAPTVSTQSVGTNNLVVNIPSGTASLVLGHFMAFDPHY